jgi:hypothetical protein
VHGAIRNDAFLGFPRQRHPALQMILLVLFSSGSGGV